MIDVYYHCMKCGARQVIVDEDLLRLARFEFVYCRCGHENPMAGIPRPELKEKLHERMAEASGHVTAPNPILDDIPRRLKNPVDLRERYRVEEAAWKKDLAHTFSAQIYDDPPTPDTLFGLRPSSRGGFSCPDCLESTTGFCEAHIPY